MLGKDSAREPRAWNKKKYTRLLGGEEFDGLLLGVSVKYLETDFIKEVEEHFGTGADPNYIDIHEKLFCGPTAKGKGKICPRDGLPDCSYVDALEPAHVGKATVMLSWCRLTSVRTVIAALSQWCRGAGRDSEETFVWQCVLCHNQYRDVGMHPTEPVQPISAHGDDSTSEGSRGEMSMSIRDPVLEKGVLTTPRGVLCEPITARCDTLNARRGMVASVSDSISAFQWRLCNIGTLLVLCTPLISPAYIRRLWCLFEFYTACAAQGAHVHIVTSEADEVDFQHALRTYGFSKYYDAFSQIDIQSAEITISPDKEGILRLLREDVAYRAALTDAGATSAETGEHKVCSCGWKNAPATNSCVACHRSLTQVASPLSSSPGHRRRKAPSFTPSQPTTECDIDSKSPIGDHEDLGGRASSFESEGKLAIMREDEAEVGKRGASPDLAVANSEIVRVLQRWLFDKAQQELQDLVNSREPVPLEAFVNVAGLLRMDSDFEPFVFFVLQQGLRYSQATSATTCLGYGVLLREMGSCLSRHGRYQEALSHFHAARRFYESSSITESPAYGELIRCMQENAAVVALHEKHQPVTNLVTFKSVPASSMQSRMSDSSGIMCQDPLQDVQAAFMCLPSCTCNSSTNDFSQIIDMPREDTKDLGQGANIPILTFSKDDVENYQHSDIMVLDFDTLMKERSQLTANRRRERKRPANRSRQEPIEPADVGFIDMLYLWSSKMGFTRGDMSCGGGMPSILQGCKHRTISAEEEWI